MEFPVLR